MQAVAVAVLTLAQAGVLALVEQVAVVQEAQAQHQQATEQQTQVVAVVEAVKTEEQFSQTLVQAVQELSLPVMQDSHKKPLVEL